MLKNKQNFIIDTDKELKMAYKYLNLLQNQLIENSLFLDYSVSKTFELTSQQSKII